jgi:hypothetical protein
MISNVNYHYEINYKNGISSYPVFSPVAGFHVAIEQADYVLQIPSDCVLREKKLNTDIEAVRTTELLIA